MLNFCARFLLSLLEYISIDFPSHFILSLIDVYRDTATRDKAYFSFGYHAAPSPFFHLLSRVYTLFRYMCHKRCYRTTESGLALQLQIETATPPASFAPSTSAPSSLAGGVTLKAVMAQLQRMDACLNTLSDELCQVNTPVSRIARWQARHGGFVESPSPSLEAFKDEDDDGDSDYNDDDEDEDANSPIDDEMST